MSSERFRVHENIFSEAAPLLKHLSFCRLSSCWYLAINSQDRYFNKRQPSLKMCSEHESATRTWFYIYLNGTTVNNQKVTYIFKISLLQLLLFSLFILIRFASEVSIRFWTNGMARILLAVVMCRDLSGRWVQYPVHLKCIVHSE